MRKTRVCTICGTRPELIRLSETVKKLDKYTDHVLVFTGQSYDYEMSQIFFEELGIREPNHRLKVKADSIGQQIGNILSQCEKVLVEEKPDTVLVLGDTNSTLSCIMAKRLGIKVIHMEAGNRCYSDVVPEEINRRIVDHTSDINLCYTEHARRNLLREGLHPKDIFVIGSPMPEVYKVHKEAINNSKVLEELGLEKRHYLLASIHREENVTTPRRLFEIIAGLGLVANEYKVPVIFSTHPRTSKELSKQPYARNNKLLLHEPFGMFDYVKLQTNALCCLSDSGTIHEDAAILGIPAVNIRAAQERPEVYDKGCVVMSGVEIEPGQILGAVRVVLDQAEAGVEFYPPEEYTETNYSDKAVRIILSVLLGGRDTPR